MNLNNDIFDATVLISLGVAGIVSAIRKTIVLTSGNTDEYILSVWGSIPSSVLGGLVLVCLRDDIILKISIPEFLFNPFYSISILLGISLLLILISYLSD